MSPTKILLLFVCSRNQWRSPTAEALFKEHVRHVTSSAAYLNECTLFDLDRFSRQHAKLLRQRGPRNT